MIDNTAITLIGSRLAKEESEFIFEGEVKECIKCRLKSTCLSLEKGRKYKIINIKTSAVHECFLHDEGVIAVEVIKSPIIAIISSRKAIKGAKINYEVPKFENIPDDMYDVCYPQGIKNGDKCIVINIIENINDENLSNDSLKKVELQL